MLAEFHPGNAAAQSSTASLRGIVSSTQGVAVPAARIELVSAATGLRRSAMTTSSGFYNIGALVPGPYTVRVLRIGMAPQQRNVILQIGDVKTLDFQMTEAATQLETVNVTARAAGSDAKTSEVGANVSTTQIENLPQNSRNFLDFATLAPGVQRRAAGISAGGASVNNSNLFVDGASYKSDVLPGGVAGQDPSLGRNIRGVGTVIGNPFPQNAVQEFRVITQNYKAEYNKATGAVVTAATKSGTNTTHGDLFSSFQNQTYLARSYWDKKDNFSQPRYNRTQFGGSIGGPIIQDKAHYFASYEGNYINLDQRVQFRPPAGLAVPDSLLTGQGLYGVPLRSNLFFGKADYQLSDQSSLIFTANIRHDRDERDFGGGTAADSRTIVGNNVNTVMLRHTRSGQLFTNEAQISFQQFQW
ncbi:MAG: carboxypeptidase regulatory-like domain-containing protein, partial [Acidobacteriota bacterium]